MIKFDQSIPDDEANLWRYQLDQFVEENQQPLAALMWGLIAQWGRESQDILGIDLKPSPHFISCSREALEKLNRKVGRKIQEIIGIVDKYKPEEEVAMIAIGPGQVKLIYFKPELPPPDCYNQLEQDLETLIGQLEQKMSEYIK